MMRKFWNDELGARDYDPADWGNLGDVIGCGYKPKPVKFSLRRIDPSIGSDGNVKIKVNLVMKNLCIKVLKDLESVLLEK